MVEKGKAHTLKTQKASGVQIEEEAMPPPQSSTTGPGTETVTEEIVHQDRDAIGALIVYVLKKLLEGSGPIVICEAQPTLKGECPHDFLQKGSLSVQVRLRAP